VHQRHRFKQEVVFGIGGVRFLEKLGYNIRKYHMNEGHTALATLEIAKRNNWDIKETKKKFSFTTHTLVPAGHEVFPMSMVESLHKKIIQYNFNDKYKSC